MFNHKRKKSGFTLIEVMIALAISSIVFSAMYSFFNFQQKNLAIQVQLAEAQQNARAALQLMSRDIVMAGYSTATIPPYSGILFANKTSLTIHYNSVGSPFSFSRYSGARIGRRSGATRQAVAEKIRRLSFSYKDKDGAALTPDASGNVTAASVKQVLISVTAGTSKFGNYSTGCTFMTLVRPRNL